MLIDKQDQLKRTRIREEEENEITGYCFRREQEDTRSKRKGENKIGKIKE